MFSKITIMTFVASLSFAALQADYSSQTTNKKGFKSQNESSEEETNTRKGKDTNSKDTFETSADEQLNKKIRDKIGGGILNKNKNVTLSTSNGIVTLSGSIDSTSDEQKLISEVLKVEGVKSVRSHLQAGNQ